VIQDNGFTQGLRMAALSQRIRELEGMASTESEETALDRAKRRVAAGAAVTREEFAAFLGVHPKMIQRMETAGRLRRCPGLGMTVRYAARDVLRLASAS
jgi:hypothetical protein